MDSAISANGGCPNRRQLLTVWDDAAQSLYRSYGSTENTRFNLPVALQTAWEAPGMGAAGAMAKQILAGGRGFAPRA